MCAVEVADIFRQYGHVYRRSHEMPLNQLRAMRAIEVCRTAELGGHVEQCDTCGAIRISSTHVEIDTVQSVSS